jgi:transcriptional regulator with XRE-family HTH domain
VGRRRSKSVASGAGPGRVQRPHVDEGLCIFQARTDARLTQAQLGARLGVTARTVSRWEVGRFAPPKRVRAALLAALAEAGAPRVDAVALALGMQDHVASRQAALEDAVRKAVDIADAKPSALRAALLHVLARAHEQGFTVAELRARLAPAEPKKRS